MQMYSSLTYGVSVRDLCLRFKPQALNIDERKLIQYGLLHGFIRRLHQYPVLTTLKSCEESTASGSFYRICNGLHSIDEICCKFNMTYQEVNERLERDPNVVIVLK
ncbi:UNVERIFIED_CONTAM: hypothetical protein GTU68_013737 [Idotea baltica]|nr:hypothetical protein [Idotea baltica]